MRLAGDLSEAVSFDPGTGRLLGLVERTESDHVVVALTPSAASDLSVASLVALPAGDDFVTAIVEGIYPTGGTTAAAPEAGAPRFGMRARVIGTLSGGVDQDPTFVPGVGRQPQVGAACHLLAGDLLTDFMTLLVRRVPVGQRLALGRFEAYRDTAAIADGNRLLQRHLAILGNTGSGKSWMVALLLERAARLAEANLIVLDVHGEYRPPARSAPGERPNLRRLRMAGPGDLESAPEEVLYLPFWLLGFEEFFTLIVNEDDPHAADQREWLVGHIETLKRAALEERGHVGEAATATADSPAPYLLDDLLRWLESDDAEVIVRQPSGHPEPGPYAGKLRGFISRLTTRALDPRYGFIFNPPPATGEDAWLVGMAETLLQTGPGRGIKAIDLSEVPAAILPMVAGVLVRFVHSIQFWMQPGDRTPVCIVCEEAHRYLSGSAADAPMDRVARERFETVAKEGRKYGVCLVVVSQRPSEVSAAILSQCNNFIVLRLNNERDQRLVEHLVSGAAAGVTGTLSTLKVGEAAVFGDAVPLPARIRLDAPVVPPASSSLEYWTLWSRKSSSADAIAAGVDALRAQSRGAVR